MFRDDGADRVEVERAAQCLAEGDEQLHFRRARRRFLRIGFGHGRVRACFATLALLVDDEDDGEDDERGNERQAGAPLDVARQIEQVPDRFREDDDQSDREADEQCPILPGDEVHRGWFSAGGIYAILPRQAAR